MYLCLLQLPFFHSFRKRLFSLIISSTFLSHNHVTFRCVGPFVHPQTFSVAPSKILFNFSQHSFTPFTLSSARLCSSIAETNLITLYPDEHVPFFCHLEKKGRLSQPVVMRILFVHELLNVIFSPII